MKGKEKVVAEVHEKSEKQVEYEKPPHTEKKIPVIFFDEAHKLYAKRTSFVFFDFLIFRSPALIHSTGAMKCLLDAMLVLTKQDRLCHVIHATSEPFYQTWLRRANVIQHCKVLLCSSLM
jgi:hypothetical protein